MKFIEKKIKEINNLCEVFHVERLYLFGSASTDTLKKTSYLDFLVKFQSFDLYYYFDNYVQLKQKLQSIFNHEIDFFEEQSLRNPILIDSINKNKKLIYG